jgi:prevent-host-death family protein
VWTVQEAKAKLSEVLNRARKGDAQFIGRDDPCVVISLTEYRRLSKVESEPHLGPWLVENFPRDTEFELPPRTVNRLDPFQDE